ncbi:MAG: hypothetical protein ACJ71I_04360 [Nitrososphaeraceae archaeon]
MSYKTDDERDKILENIKKSTKDFQNLADRQKASLIERYQDEFEHEIKQCEEFNKRGDYFNAKLHFDRATSANELIKNLRKFY